MVDLPCCFIGFKLVRLLPLFDERPSKACRKSLFRRLFAKPTSVQRVSEPLLTQQRALLVVRDDCLVGLFRRYDFWRYQHR